VNVKKLIAVALLSLIAGLSVACSGAGPTPTRTPQAVAENNPTQTPWIIYVPVTNTPEPFTVTPLPTVTASQPTPRPTNTRAPRTAAPVVRATAAPRATPTSADSPTPPPPPPTPTPSCGQTYQVTQLIFPADGDTRQAKAGGGASKTIQFKWTPVASYKLDPKIGYHVIITAPKNSTELYISHDGYLDVMNGNGAVLSQQATWGLTNGDDVDIHWNVTVVYSSGGYDDQTFTIIGTATPCGPVSPTYTVHLQVVQ
jgi:hypothetical protein